jgi:hypothetical protein
VVVAGFAWALAGLQAPHSTNTIAPVTAKTSRIKVRLKKRLKCAEDSEARTDERMEGIADLLLEVTGFG